MDYHQLWALAFLSLLISLPFLAWLYAWMHRGHYSTWEFALYSFAYSVCRMFWRVSVKKGTSDLAHLAKGGVIVANHRCSVDPCFVQLAAGRRVHWMVAGEYCRHFLFGPILKVFQVIPTNRGGMDSKAIKMAIRYCEEGRMIGMFPEGRLNRTQAPLLPIRAGAALIALRANVPLIPVWIEGAPEGEEIWSPFLQYAMVTIHVGKPIAPPDDLVRNRERGDENSAKTWLATAMVEALKLGGFAPRSVTFAGRNWKDAQHAYSSGEPVGTVHAR